ncbi:60 kDa inner membrane protein YIDC [Mycetohabitans rhizoxinica HKI 454]|uniref:Membrane protein insertase YidC n=2 Tax=Mycetohabitans rhizoxinica TaxID=412963 RepID=E5ANF4_MYCRK|nr:MULTISPECIES: membrane protein insertase YidC [Mycetohabitans]MCG1045895.1 membrane protein insertase YidC [Mycetohabitans sp. B6]CBW76407.1 60 kDa inner membrane protein YIDC [Mycetohabitans rhizoxinica HKI 454]
MDIKRTVLWVIFFMSVVMLYDNWQRDHGRLSLFFPNTTPTQTAASATPGTTTPGTQLADLPQTTESSSAPGTAPAMQPVVKGQQIHFKTDVYDGDISTVGGTLSRLSLVKEGDGKQPNLYITLFDQTANHTYLARTGLIGGDFPNHNDVFTVVPGPTSLTDGANTVSISLESPVKAGVKVVKTYTFTRGSYVIGVDTKIENVGAAPVKPTVYMELVRDDTPVETPRFSHTFIGPAVYTEQHKFQKMSFSDLDKGKQDYAPSADNGWVAMVQHYFASAWIPKEGAQRQFYADKFSQALYRVGMKEPVQSIAPGQSVNVAARLFAGPQEERKLEKIAPGLELVKDYGWVTIIAKPLFWLLEKIHGFVGNWGWAIVLLTLLIKAVFFPLSAASYKSMARMKEITPRMQQIRERFKSDPQKMNAALMELYKSEKVNPFGGCLPIVIQIPVFISLYWVLLSSVEMRGAPWVLWIHDLSQQDPYFILPVLMAVSMFVQTKLNPTPPDPVQAKMMMFMPIAFSVMFFFFPAGLVLYYVVNNVLSIAQQYYITRMMGKDKKA